MATRSPRESISVQFPAFSEPQRITSGPKEHFFASYYGIDAWSEDGRYALVLETDLRTRLPTAAEAATVGVVDQTQGNRFFPLTDTRCWNFQEGTMAHWLGPRRLVYNDRVEGRFVSVVLDMDTGQKRIVPFPVSAVAPDRRTCLSINYARLARARPAYGYAGDGQDSREQVTWPEDDGLWRVDLETGEARLIVSVASVRDRMEPVASPHALAYFCHTAFSPTGQWIFWLARTEGDGPRRTTAWVCDPMGTRVLRCFPEGWSGSHFAWLDGERLLVTVRYRRGFWSHVLWTVGTDAYERLGGGLLDFDGHATFSPNGRWLVTDTYPDALGERRLLVMDLGTGALLSLGTFEVPAEYWKPERYLFGTEAVTRCDLHPRWRSDGRMLGFNSVHEGSRQVYIMNVGHTETDVPSETRPILPPTK